MSKSWINFFLKNAIMWSTRSKDPSTKVGCVIVQGKLQISQGYNGLPKGLNDTHSRLNDRALKLKLTKHAEENAILHGRKEDLKGATLFVNAPPCSFCAGDMIQVGIAEVHYIIASDNFMKRYAEDNALAVQMLQEVGIRVIEHSKESINNLEENY